MQIDNNTTDPAVTCPNVDRNKGDVWGATTTTLAPEIEVLAEAHPCQFEYVAELLDTAIVAIKSGKAPTRQDAMALVESAKHMVSSYPKFMPVDYETDGYEASDLQADILYYLTTISNRFKREYERVLALHVVPTEEERQVRIDEYLREDREAGLTIGGIPLPEEDRASHIDAWHKQRSKEYLLAAELLDHPDRKEALLTEHRENQAKELQAMMRRAREAQQDLRTNRPPPNVEDYVVVREGLLTADEAERYFNYQELNYYNHILATSDDEFYVEYLRRLIIYAYQTDQLQDLGSIEYTKISNIITSPHLASSILDGDFDFHLFVDATSEEVNSLANLADKIVLYNSFLRLVQRSEFYTQDAILTKRDIAQLATIPTTLNYDISGFEEVIARVDDRTILARNISFLSDSFLGRMPEHYDDIDDMTLSLVFVTAVENGNTDLTSRFFNDETLLGRVSSLHLVDALYSACENDDIDSVTAIMRNKTVVRKICDEGQENIPAILQLLASEHNHLEIFKMLLSNQMIIDTLSFEGSENLILHIARSSDHLQAALDNELFMSNIGGEALKECLDLAVKHNKPQNAVAILRNERALQEMGEVIVLTDDEVERGVAAETVMPRFLGTLLDRACALPYTFSVVRATMLEQQVYTISDDDLGRALLTASSKSNAVAMGDLFNNEEALARIPKYDIGYAMVTLAMNGYCGASTGEILANKKVVARIHGKYLAAIIENAIRFGLNPEVVRPLLENEEAVQRIPGDRLKQTFDYIPLMSSITSVLLPALKFAGIPQKIWGDTVGARLVASCKEDDWQMAAPLLANDSVLRDISPRNLGEALSFAADFDHFDDVMRIMRKPAIFLRIPREFIGKVLDFAADAGKETVVKELLDAPLTLARMQRDHLEDAHFSAKRNGHEPTCAVLQSKLRETAATDIQFAWRQYIKNKKGEDVAKAA